MSDLIRVDVSDNLKTFTKSVRVQIGVGARQEISNEAFDDVFPHVRQEMATRLVDQLEPLFADRFASLRRELEAERQELREARSTITALNRALIALTKEFDASAE